MAREVGAITGSSSLAAGDAGVSATASTLTVYGSPWTTDNAFPDARQYRIAVSRSTRADATVDVRSWVKQFPNSRRVSPHAVTFSNDPVALHHLSDGRVQAIRLTDTMIAPWRRMPRGVQLDPERPAPSIALRSHRSGAVQKELLRAPFPRRVTPEVARLTLAEIRASWPNESRISQTHIAFSKQDGARSMRLVFDETIGAEVESELRDPMGFSVIMHSSYAPDAGGYRLARLERIVSDARGSTRYVEAFDAPKPDGWMQ